MWKGRFQSETAEAVKNFGESVSYDWRLYRHDIAGSIAHAHALHDAGILTACELTQIEEGLKFVQLEIESGNFEFSESLEDVHMNIESALTAQIGSAGAKLHTARSRNDQVTTDLRLYLRDEIDAISRGIRGFQSELVQFARRAGEVLLPGYTHLQRAQPVFFAHHLLAYVEMLERDLGRLADARARMNVLPLGSGAIAGSTIILDREAVAARLGFDGVTHNSMDAVSDRDFVVELLGALALLGVHLSRLGEDVILWASSEFGFVKLSDRYTTGSSLMPQKKNPDVAELTRGKTGRLIGNLVSLLTTIKGLPMTYNRDLQEDKEPVFDSVDTVKISLEVFAGMISEAEVVEPAMSAAAADPMLLATDIADYLVLKGIPFRQAHEIVGKLVAHCIGTGKTFPELQLSEYQALSPAFTDEVFDLFSLTKAMEARQATGAPSLTNIRKEIARWQASLAK